MSPADAQESSAQEAAAPSLGGSGTSGSPGAEPGGGSAVELPPPPLGRSQATATAIIKAEFEPSPLQPSRPLPGPLDIKPEFVGEASRPRQAAPLPAPLPLPDPADGDGVSDDHGADPYLGRTFGGYVLERKVGQGGMGLVYKGRQVSLDRVVAIKILNRALNENQEFIKRFEREAKSIAKFNHPHIVAVYDFGNQDGHWFMACEFIEGYSLARMITDRLMIPVDELTVLMIHCLDALAHVGSLGVVHRDIKPDNILITKDGQAKIADFGLAKDVSNPNDHTDLTAIGMAMGTPAYMSPEQCMGRKLDGRSDLYALGVTAYYSLTGEKPFTGQSSFEIMTKQREFVPPAPHQLNPTLPRACSDLVMRMLAKNPLDRFPDAAACRTAWMALLDQLHAPPVAQVARTQESMRSSVELPPPPGAAPRTLDLAPAAPPLGERRPTTDAHRPQPTNLRRPTVEIQIPQMGVEQGGQQAQRSGSERQSRPAPAVTGRPRNSEFATCPKCGALNRPDAMSCGKCSAVLREEPPGDVRQQESEAQRLFDERRYKEAAALFAKLADREGDRRSRSILRSREREARKLDHEQQVAEIRGKAKALEQRGDIRGAIATLEQGRALGGDPAASAATAVAGATTITLDAALVSDITVLRTRLVRRSRLVWVVIVIGLIAAGVAGWFLWLRLALGPVPPTTSALPTAYRDHAS